MLKFYAKSNLLVRVPGSQARPNQPDMYVGRDFDPANRGYPANKDGFEVDENTESGKRLIRLTMIDSSLYPANKETAAACGVEFLQVEFRDGSFVESKPVSNSSVNKSKLV